MKVLVIGGAGYLGSVLCRKLLNKQYEVRVLDCLMYGDDGIKDLYDNDKFELIKGDIRNISDLVLTIEGVDVVIHLAAIVGDPASALNPEETVEINYLSTKLISWACKYNNVKRLIFASTCSVYGCGEKGKLLDEQSEINPLSLYAEMKIKSENALLNDACEKFTPTILRMGTLYGLSQRMRFDLVANYFTIKALVDNEFRLFGGNQERCFCHVNDAADVYIRCIESCKEKVHREIFNVASSNMSILDLGKIIKEYVNNECKLEIDDKKVDDRSYVVDSSKIKNCIGWNPTCDIESFVNEMKFEIDKWKDYDKDIYSNVKYLKNRGMLKL